MALLTLLFEPKHPAFAGHFPGRPIVPGVLMLDWAQSALEAELGLRFQTLSEAKFHSPATPADHLVLDYELGAAALRFEIRSGDRKIASGRFPLPVSSTP